MKSTKNLFYALIALSAMTFVGCGKDVQTSPVSVDLSQKATVTGYIYADIDQTSAGKESIPSNVQVIVSVPNNNLLAGATGNWVDTVTTDNTGKFVAIVPTNTSGVNVTVTTTDFVANQVQPLTSHYQTIKKIFSGAAQASFKIFPGESKIKTFEYGDPTNFGDFVNIVTVSGKAYAETDLNNSVEENAPLIDVIFSANDWSKKVTLVTSGAYTTYSVDVPYGETISYTFDFTAYKNVSDGQGGWIKVQYRYHGTNVLNSYSSDTEDVNLDFGTGVKVQ